jgi:hypothetical protein
LGHEGAFVNLFVGVFIERRIKVIDIRFGLLFAELFPSSGFSRLAHLQSSEKQTFISKAVIIAPGPSQVNLAIWK